jgi:hypothetical protein
LEQRITRPAKKTSALGRWFFMGTNPTTQTTPLQGFGFE